MEPGKPGAEAAKRNKFYATERICVKSAMAKPRFVRVCFPSVVVM